MDHARVGADDELAQVTLSGRRLYSRVFGGFIADDAVDGEFYSIQTRLTHAFHSVTMAGSRNIVLFLQVTCTSWDDPYTSLSAQSLVAKLSYSANGSTAHVPLFLFHQSEDEGTHQDGRMVGHDAEGNYIDDYDFYNPLYWRKFSPGSLDEFKEHLANDDPLLNCDLEPILSKLCVDFALDCQRKGYLRSRDLDCMHPWVRCSDLRFTVPVTSTLVD